VNIGAFPAFFKTDARCGWLPAPAYSDGTQGGRPPFDPVAAPHQRNNEDEKKAIKQGRIPKDWKNTADPDNIIAAIEAREPC